MRCDQSGGADSRPWGNFFAANCAPGVRTNVREFPHETASVHGGNAGGAERGSVPLLRAVGVSIVETRTAAQTCAAR